LRIYLDDDETATVFSLHNFGREDDYDQLHDPLQSSHDPMFDEAAALRDNLFLLNLSSHLLQGAPAQNRNYL